MTPSTISTTQVNFQKLKIKSLYHIYYGPFENFQLEKFTTIHSGLGTARREFYWNWNSDCWDYKSSEKAADDDCEIPRLELNNETVETEGWNFHKQTKERVKKRLTIHTGDIGAMGVSKCLCINQIDSRTEKPTAAVQTME